MANPDTKDKVIERQMREIKRLRKAIDQMVRAAPDNPDVEDIAFATLSDQIDSI